MFKFSENPEVESLDSVPENLRQLYAEDDGRYVLNDSLKSVAMAIDGLNNANFKARRDAKEAKAQSVDLSPLADFGQTPEEIREAIEAKLGGYEEQLAKGKDAKLDLAKVKEELARGYNERATAAETKYQQLEQQLATVLVENAATDAIAKAKGDSKLLMPFLQQNVRMVEEKMGDGSVRRVARVFDADGDLRYSSATGEPMTVAERVVEMKTDPSFAKLFDSDTPRGSGARPAPARGSAPSGTPIGGDSPAARIQRGLMKRG